MRRLTPWLVVWGLTLTLTVHTAAQSLERYREFRSGWSWDLAYYNQWFWALTRGDGVLSVRPIGPWVQEGPPVWKMNYLSPVRLAILPIYRLFPGPPTLLVVQAVVFWMIVPAAFVLVRGESGSPALAVSAAALVPLTPLLWPLAWNDFRELQLALPFVLLAVHGVRSRDVRLTVLGVGGLLACRQEFALLVASLAVLPPRRPEDIGRRYRWARALWLTGLGWLLFGFLGYSRWLVNSNALEIFLGELAGQRAPLGQTLVTAADFLLVGLGSWAVLACLTPRAALLAVPWVWSLSAGRWSLRFIGTEQWHHVRYTAPMAAMVLAAGCLGYARLGGWVSDRRYGPALLSAVWMAAAIGLLVACRRLESRFDLVPRPISASESAALRNVIARVGQQDGVLAHYEVTAPLSSRRRLYSYVMVQNQPPGYPRLGPEIEWVFARAGDIPGDLLTRQGFRLVHPGPHILVHRREPRSGADAIAAPSPSRGTRERPGSQGSGVPRDHALGAGVLVLIEVFRTAALLAPGLALCVWSRRRVIAARALGPAGSSLTGKEVAAAVLASGRQGGLTVKVDDGPFADYYDPDQGTVRLSEAVAAGRLFADQAVAAREAAHAIRHAEGGYLQTLRNPLIFATRLGTSAGWLTMAAGAALGSWLLVQAGAFLVTASVIGPLPLLWPLENDTSRFAERLLSDAGLIPPGEHPATASALTAFGLSHL